MLVSGKQGSPSCVFKGQRKETAWWGGAGGSTEDNLKVLTEGMREYGPSIIYGDIGRALWCH